jgi:hypothetical protein
LRTLLLGGAAAAMVLSAPAPAFASAGSGPLHLPPRIKIDLPASLPDLTLALGPQSTPAAPHEVITTRATHLVRNKPAAPRTPRHVGRLAVTAPGLISVVPIGPLPAALRPRVATETVPSAARTGGSDATILRAPPIGFWFLLVLLVLMLGSTTYLVGGRRRYVGT